MTQADQRARNREPIGAGLEAAGSHARRTASQSRSARHLPETTPPRRTRRARERRSATSRRPRPSGSPAASRGRTSAAATAPSVCAACSCSVPISRSTGIASRATKGSDTNIVASIIPGTREDDLDPLLGEPPAEPPVDAPVDEDQRQAHDHRRDGERQVHHASRGRPRKRWRTSTSATADPEDRVERHGDRHHDYGQPEGVLRLRCRDRVPRGAHAILEGAEEDHGHRDRQQQRR